MDAPAPKSARPAAAIIPIDLPDADAVYAKLEGGHASAMARFQEALSKGEAEVVDAILYCARFDEQGRVLRENGVRAYQLLPVNGPAKYREAMGETQRQLGLLTRRQRRAASREADRPKTRRPSFREGWPFLSSSDLGSTYQQDPNQFTEYTPYYNGPFSKQQYFDYFAGHARAYQEYTHSPVGKRIVDILVQYALGRGFKVRSKKPANDKKWRKFNRKNRITHKTRKYWAREYLIYGENFIDKMRWVSIDPSTIIDIICEGYDEHIDDVLYYQQMFQTATQTYAGLRVPGVPGSKDSKIGKYIVRQIPADQVIHIKTNVVSVEKRGRSVLYSVLGWIKRLTDTFNAQILGEQLRASFVWDDEVKGGETEVAAHAAKYQYIPVAPSIFVHNESVKRTPLAPMANISQGQSNIIQELLALIATAVGLPKDHLNVFAGGGSNRATAIVGAEPFTKVIEDLQEDLSDLLHQVLAAFCAQAGIDYDEDEWEVIFPSVQKDALNDRLKAIATCESMGWFSKERAANMAAAEMEADNYDAETELSKIADETSARLAAGLPGASTPPPAGRYGPAASGPGGSPDEPDRADKNPIHGKGKKDIVRQHKNL
jgi:hypothetical protein